MIRDQALAPRVARAKIGGASVQPYKPEGVWEAGWHFSGRANTRELPPRPRRRPLSTQMYWFWSDGAAASMEHFKRPEPRTCTVRLGTHQHAAAKPLVTMHGPAISRGARHNTHPPLQKKTPTTHFFFWDSTPFEVKRTTTDARLDSIACG